MSVTWNTPFEQAPLLPGEHASAQEIASFVEDELYQYLDELTVDEQRESLRTFCRNHGWQWSLVQSCLREGPFAATVESDATADEEGDASAARGEVDDELTQAPSGIDIPALVTRLHVEGCSNLDIADEVRRAGGRMGDLAQSMRALGYSTISIGAAIKHAAEDCPHESEGDIETLPVLPVGRTPLLAVKQDIREIADDTWDAIHEANEPVQFLNFGGLSTWIKASDADQAVIEEITKGRMLFLIGEIGEWFIFTRDGPAPARPPKDLADHMVANPHPPLPRLRRLVSAPVFDFGGRLVVRPGYHAESGIFFAPRGLEIRPVSHAPTSREIAEALDLITHELLGDFDFVDQADLTNAVALMFLPFVRDLIDGPTPLHLITKPVAGSGGTLLVELLFFPALGKQPAMQGMPDNEAEVQRRITAALLANPAVVVFDNLKKPLASGQVCSAITAREWEDRQIRTSTLLTLPVTNAWAATGNNARVNDEIARRTAPIRLDPHTDKPYERTGWRHPDILGWTRQNRSELVRAVLTCIQSWVAEGMPEGSLTMGKFERWAGVMSGIMQVIGSPGLMENWREWSESRPSELNLRRKVQAMWASEFGDRWLKAKDLLPVIGSMFDIDPDGGHSALTMLGTRLRNWQDTEVDGFEIITKEVSGSASWRLVRRS